VPAQQGGAVLDEELVPVLRDAQQLADDRHRHRQREGVVEVDPGRHRRQLVEVVVDDLLDARAQPPHLPAGERQGRLSPCTPRAE
jgi:hypothetical protein